MDSSDRDRIAEAAEVFNRLATDEELKDATVLVYANKQDLPGALTVPELTEALGLHKLPKDRNWYIQASNARTGDGLYEGMDWVSRNYHVQKA